MLFTLDKNKCVQCNICSHVCSPAIITKDDGGWPTVDDKKAARCIKCGHCMVYCPKDACSIDNIAPEKLPVVKKDIPQTEQAELFLQTRRSTRWYTNEELKDETLLKIIKLASTAPTAKNTQQVEWAVVNGRQKLKLITNYMADLLEELSKQASSRQEKAMLNAMVFAYRKGMDVFLRNAAALVTAIIPSGYYWKEDAVIATTYLELFAHANNLGTCWAGYFLYYARQDGYLRTLAGIPEDYNIAGALMMGIPVIKNPRHIPARNEAKIYWQH